MLKKIMSSLRYKISCIFIVLITVFTILCGAIYAKSFTKQSFENYYSSSYSILSGINSRFEDYIQQMDIYFTFILYPDSNTKEMNEMESIKERIRYVFNDNSNIESIFYYTTDNKNLTVVSNNRNKAYKNMPDVENCTWYRCGIISDEAIFIQPQHKHVIMKNLTGIDNNSEVFSYIKNYVDKDGNTNVLCINIYEQYMNNICSNSLTQEGEVLQCLNELGEVIYSTENKFSLYDREEIYEHISMSKEKTGYFSYVSSKDKEKKTVVFVKSIGNSNIIYKCVENGKLNRAFIQGLKMMILASVVILLIVIIVALYLANSLTKPMNELKLCLDEFSSGNTAVRIESARKDEFKDMSDSFNQMASRIDQLIKEKYKLQLYNREAQIYSLLAQINPHFVNNILQSIGGAALERGMKDIYKAATALAKMLRYSIKEDNVVSLGKELQNLRDYLFIQKFRFEEKLEVTINVRHSIEDITIPKLSLQPLVENAIVHGFESKKGVGHLAIEVSNDGRGTLRITIKDDGRGISERILMEIKNELKTENFEIEKNHIGLHNVYRRLKYLYGDRFSMDIQSVYGKGTEISIEIEGESKNVQYNHS